MYTHIAWTSSVPLACLCLSFAGNAAAEGAYLQPQLILARQLRQPALPALLLRSQDALLLAAGGIAVSLLPLLPALHAL